MWRSIFIYNSRNYLGCVAYEYYDEHVSIYNSRNYLGCVAEASLKTLLTLIYNSRNYLGCVASIYCPQDTQNLLIQQIIEDMLFVYFETPMN